MNRSEWAEAYQPKEFLFGGGVHLNQEENGRSFTRIGKVQPEFGEVIKADPNTVWTEIEVDGMCFIVPGYHVVNSEGYYITERAFDPGLDLEVEVFGRDDLMELEMEHVHHFLDTNEDVLSAPLRAALGRFADTLDASALDAREPSTTVFSGVSDGDLLDEFENHFCMHVEMGKVSENSVKKVRSLLERGSLEPTPKRKPSVGGPGF